MSVVLGGWVFPRLGSGHCKEVAVQVTLDSFALLPRWESDKVQALWRLLCVDKWLDKWET